METIIYKFCQVVRKRSGENQKSFSLLCSNKLYGQSISVLRQELDSMVRCLYLLNLKELSARNELANQTLEGKRWYHVNKRPITDRDMVNIANHLHGWTQSVYKFGCAFIHLSSFHDYEENNPFQNISNEEETIVKQHLNSFHGYRLDQPLTLASIIPYLPNVFDKVRGNLLCYVKDLENEKMSPLI